MDRDKSKKTTARRGRPKKSEMSSDTRPERSPVSPAEYDEFESPHKKRGYEEDLHDDYSERGARFSSTSERGQREFNYDRGQGGRDFYWGEPEHYSRQSYFDPGIDSDYRNRRAGERSSRENDYMSERSDTPSGGYYGNQRGQGRDYTAGDYDRGNYGRERDREDYRTRGQGYEGGYGSAREHYGYGDRGGYGYGSQQGDAWQSRQRASNAGDWSDWDYGSSDRYYPSQGGYGEGQERGRRMTYHTDYDPDFNRRSTESRERRPAEEEDYLGQRNEYPEPRRDSDSQGWVSRERRMMYRRGSDYPGYQRREY